MQRCHHRVLGWTFPLSPIGLLIPNSKKNVSFIRSGGSELSHRCFYFVPQLNEECNLLDTLGKPKGHSCGRVASFVPLMNCILGRYSEKCDLRVGFSARFRPLIWCWPFLNRHWESGTAVGPRETLGILVFLNWLLIRYMWDVIYCKTVFFLCQIRTLLWWDCFALLEMSLYLETGRDSYLLSLVCVDRWMNN